jgi:hypothetical protein
VLLMTLTRAHCTFSVWQMPRSESQRLLDPRHNLSYCSSCRVGKGHLTACKGVQEPLELPHSDLTLRRKLRTMKGDSVAQGNLKVPNLQLAPVLK